MLSAAKSPSHSTSFQRKDVPRENSPTGTFPIDPWYVTGFCEGSGTFTYNRNGVRNVALVFALKETPADNGNLRSVMQFFGVGRMYEVKPSTPAARNGQTKSVLYYRVTKASDLMKIVSHFDRYPLRGRKRRSYALWREAVLLKQRLFRVDWDRMNSIVQRLSQLQNRKDDNAVPS
jgi:hypothetical protein